MMQVIMDLIVEVNLNLVRVELIDQQLESPFNLTNMNADDREKLINKLKQQILTQEKD